MARTLKCSHEEHLKEAGLYSLEEKTGEQNAGFKDLISLECLVLAFLFTISTFCSISISFSIVMTNTVPYIWNLEKRS